MIRRADVQAREPAALAGLAGYESSNARPMQAGDHFAA